MHIIYNIYIIRLVRDCQKTHPTRKYLKVEYEEVLSKSGYSTKFSHINNLSYKHNTSNRNSNFTSFSNNNAN